MRYLVFICTFFLLSGAAFAESPRLENEIKLSMPETIAPGVWKWLTLTYPTHCQIDNSYYQCTKETEYFSDTYFDDGRASLADKWAGIRHRRRTYEDGKTNELIQIKITPKNSETVRQEIKFSVRGGKKVVIDSDTHPLLQRLERDERDSFVQTLTNYNIDALALRPVLPLNQERKRIYIGDPDALLTITFDEMSSARWWVKETAYELEIEINESRYTEGNPQERASFEEMQQEVLKSLLDTFPQITQDQTPKYTKMFERVFDQIPFGHLLLKWGLL